MYILGLYYWWRVRYKTHYIYNFNCEFSKVGNFWSVQFCLYFSHLLSFVVHVGSVRQTATIMNMTKEHLRTGDKSIVRFRFIKNPEYLKTDMRMVFREGRTKAIGNITKLYPHVSAVAQNTRQQRAAKKAQEANHQVHPQNEPQKPSKKRRTRNNSKSVDMEESKENVPSTSSSSVQEVTVQSWLLTHESTFLMRDLYIIWQSGKQNV